MFRTSLSFVFLCIANFAFGQEDTLQHINEPAGQEERYWRQLPQDIGPAKDSVELDFKRLPDKVKATLKEDEYQGWDDKSIYFDKTTKLYKLRMVKGKTIRIIGINENGKPVSFHEVTTP